MKTPFWIGLISACVFLVSGCVGLNKSAKGGLAHNFVADHYYEVDANQELTRSQLKTHLEIQQTQLDLFVLQGAMYCMPASIQRLTLLSHRIRKEIEAELFEDAAHQLIALQRELRYLRKKFNTVTALTHCHQSNDQIPNPVTFSVYFDSNSSHLLTPYKNKISWWVMQTNAQGFWTVYGHTDTSGSQQKNDELAQERVNEVKDILMSLNVKHTSIESKTLGERQPALADNHDFAFGINRRVDLYWEPYSIGFGIPVKEWEALNLKKPRTLTEEWQ